MLIGIGFFFAAKKFSDLKAVNGAVCIRYDDTGWKACTLDLKNAIEKASAENDRARMLKGMPSTMEEVATAGALDKAELELAAGSQYPVYGEFVSTGDFPALSILTRAVYENAVKIGDFALAGDATALLEKNKICLGAPTARRLDRQGRKPLHIAVFGAEQRRKLEWQARLFCSGNGLLRYLMFTGKARFYDVPAAV